MCFLFFFLLIYVVLLFRFVRVCFCPFFVPAFQVSVGADPQNQTIYGRRGSEVHAPDPGGHELSAPAPDNPQGSQARQRVPGQGLEHQGQAYDLEITVAP